MRTTLDINDDIAIRAKKAAIERRTSLKKLVEQGLRRVLEAPEEPVSNPLDSLKGLGRETWRGVNPGRYVQRLRQGWNR